MDQDELEALIIERLLPREALGQFKAGAVSHDILRPLAQHIQDLSKRFLAEKSVHYPSKEACIAYALYYLPINFQKITFLLGMTPESLLKKRIRLLDVGAGPGTALFGALGAGLTISEAILCEKSPYMRSVGESLTGRLKLNTSWVSSMNNIDGAFDIIVAANVITEVNEKSDFVLKLANFLSSDGALLLLEPGTFASTRSLMELRNLLLSSDSKLSPLFPCTHSNPCPMLEKLPNDWCHGTLSNERSKLIRDLDSLTGFNKHRTKYSAFFVARNGLTPIGLRVIGEPQKDRRGTQAMLCGKDFFGVRVEKSGTEEAKKLSKAKSFGIIP